ncbi:hypothetical protein EVB91_201 [Rhizobium phage RHph_I1_18]|nr:hypothetical protein EVB91_201 [Rhizobium phage RHph_I1_18]
MTASYGRVRPKKDALGQWVRFEDFERLQQALQEIRDAIMRADPQVLTDTLWMPEDVLMGATVVDRIDIALEQEDG